MRRSRVKFFSNLKFNFIKFISLSMLVSAVCGAVFLSKEITPKITSYSYEIKISKPNSIK